MLSGVAAVAVGDGFDGATGTSVAVIESGGVGSDISPSARRGVRAVQQRLPQLGISLDPLPGQ